MTKTETTMRTKGNEYQNDNMKNHVWKMLRELIEMNVQYSFFFTSVYSRVGTRNS